MSPIRIDFAPRSLGRELASMGPLSLLFAGVGVALCLVGIFEWNELAQRQGARQAEMERVQAGIAARGAHVASAPIATISEAQAIVVNSAIQQLNLPWSRVLDAIERATPSSVALLELEPDAKRHLVKGVAEARNVDVMIDYIGRLKQQPFFGNAVLTRHEVNKEADGQDANPPLRFEFEAEWRAVER